MSIVIGGRKQTTNSNQKAIVAAMKTVYEAGRRLGYQVGGNFTSLVNSIQGVKSNERN